MMNSTGHLPAGQPMQGNADMGIPRMNGGPGGQGHLGQGHGPRRGRPHHNHYNPGAHHHHGQYHQPHVAHNPMYAANYMPQPYGVPPGYYAPPAYQNAAMTNPYGMPQYAPPATYARSPPAMQHYMPMVAQNPYARPAPPQSPIVSTPYQAPPMATPALVPVPAPHTPSSTHSHVVPTPMTPPVQQMPPIVPPQPQVQSQPQVQVQPEPEPEIQQKVVEEPVVAEDKQPAQAEVDYSHFASPQKSDKPPFSLPWYSHPGTPFPTRTKLRKRRQAPSAASENVSLPAAPGQESASETTQAAPAETTSTETVQEGASIPTPKGTPKLEVLPPRSETPSTQELPSVDTPSTSPTSSVPSQQFQVSESIATSPSQPPKQATRVPVPAVPAIPVVPVLPKPAPKDKPATSAEKPSAEVKPAGSAPASEQTSDPAAKDVTASTPDASAPAEQAAPAPAPAPAKPKSWATLFTKPAAPVNTAAAVAAAAAAAATAAAQTTVNGHTATDAAGVTAGVVPGFAQPKANSMAEAVQSYRVGTAEKIAFLEPRGLVNTGNMCYMNSVSGFSFPLL